MTLEKIGIFKSKFKKKYELPRQPRLIANTGYVELDPKLNLPQALKDLDAFSHLWLIYGFHLNDSWKPIVKTPNENESNKGVFATRSPYRPNSIGLSSCKLEKIARNKIFVSSHDLLDGTPIFDIKPYIKSYDSIDEANDGWVQNKQLFKIEFSLEFIQQVSHWPVVEKEKIINFINVQLSQDPFHVKQKRVKQQSNNSWVLCYGIQRVNFYVDKDVIKIKNLHSDQGKNLVGSTGLEPVTPTMSM